MSGITDKDLQGLQGSQGYVCFLANAGIFIHYNDMSLLIDGLQRGPSRFSAMSEEQIQDVITGKGMFRSINCMLVTHEHADHYDAQLTRRFLRAHPESILISPVTPTGRGVGKLEQEEGYAIMPGIDVHFLQLLHEGKEYEDVVNYAYDIRLDDFEFIVLGDAAMSKTAIAHLTEGREIDAAFLNFPFLTLKAGRAILKSALRAKQVFIFHLPFEQDDTENYRKSALWTASKAKELGLPPITLLAFPDMCVPLRQDGSGPVQTS